MDWTITRLDGIGSRHDILELRETVFPLENPEKQRPEYWDWEFENGSFGRSEIYAVLEAGNLVGHYAFLPQVYRIGEEFRTAGLAVDAMVHPRHRRKGMFSALQEYALRHTDRTFAIGYTIRKEVLPAEIKGGYQIVKKTPVWVFPLRFDAIFQRVFKSSFPAAAAGRIARAAHRAWFRRKTESGGLTFRDVDRLGDSVGDFFERKTRPHEIQLEKSAEYLSWRFDAAPGVTYEKVVALDPDAATAGYAVLRRETLFGLDTLAVVDMETRDGSPESADALIGMVISRAETRNCDCAALMILDDGRWTSRLRKRGFLKSPYFFNLIVHDCGRPGTAEKIRRSGSVFLNWSDTDML